LKTKVVIIGAGFSGLAAATCLARKGYQVTLLEKNDQTGGRARKLQSHGYTFDMGPTWYWMPDVFENYFKLFGKSPEDYYSLERLSPSYRIFFGKNDYLDVPSDIEEMYALFEELEPGSSSKLKKFLAEAAYKYDISINDLVFKPGQSIFEFADKRVIKGIFKMHLFRSFSKYIRKYFSHPKIISLLEFPVLFLGAKPEDTPALYSMMNYADIQLGTWYPKGGMYEVVKGMTVLAQEQNVTIELNASVTKIEIHDNTAVRVHTKNKSYDADVVIGGADYHHIEQHLLEPQFRTYKEKYWESRTLAPSCLIYYLGINKKLQALEHHSLLFDESFDLHASEIYDHPKWPTKPLIYISCPSKTDPNAAPEGHENLMILIPVAPGLQDNEATRSHYYNLILDRLEHLTGESIKSHVTFKKSYAHNNFIADYNSFKGNAYGLANTLRQTAILRPSLKSKKVSNLFFTGQLTVPGPGVPPALISGQVVATEVSKTFQPEPIL
jgi:phytoene desaturase